MNILFISNHKWPHVGGVEKHIEKVTKFLKNNGHSVTTISSKDIKFPKVKVVGLLYIWYWFFKNRKIILNSDVVHVHDVFIWYLPFRFIYPNKKVFVTFHGWEGKYPIPYWNILNKKLSAKLVNGHIAVGKYIDKYYGISSDLTIYGAVDSINNNKFKKSKNTICYLGRFEKDTGLEEFLNWLSINPIKYKVTFVGEGELKNKCLKFGRVVDNSQDVYKFLKTSEYCVPSGYLSYLEAKNVGCKILTFPNNPLKVSYWDDIEKIKEMPTWGQVADIYMKLWK